LGEAGTAVVELTVGELDAIGRGEEQPVRVVRAALPVEVGKRLDQRPTG